MRIYYTIRNHEDMISWILSGSKIIGKMFELTLGNFWFRIGSKSTRREWVRANVLAWFSSQLRWWDNEYSMLRGMSGMGLGAIIEWWCCCVTFSLSLQNISPLDPKSLKMGWNIQMDRCGHCWGMDSACAWHPSCSTTTSCRSVRTVRVKRVPSLETPISASSPCCWSSHGSPSHCGSVSWMRKGHQGGGQSRKKRAVTNKEIHVGGVAQPTSGRPLDVHQGLCVGTPSLPRFEDFIHRGETLVNGW